MSRNPGESAEQWSARAAAEYHAAWNALGNEPQRMLTRISEGMHSSDQIYDEAMDRLAAADCERGDAAIAVDRERPSPRGRQARQC
jgi:hypothetical protein